MRAKHIFLALIIATWLGAAGFATRYVAGGIYFLIHKANPVQVTANTWGQYWDQYRDDPKEKKRLQGSMGVSVFLLFFLPAFLVLANIGKKRGLHGDARWANAKEAEEAGLFGTTGLILGKFNGKFLMIDQPKFVMLVAPTRSGKGVGTIIPNLLNWQDSVIAVDIKGENYGVTSGFRAKHQKVFRFSPFDPEFRTHCFNPMSYINPDPMFVVGELQSLGYMLYPKGSGSDSFWADQARNLFVGVSLYVLESGLTLSVGEVLRRSNGGGRPKDFWQKVVDDGVGTNGQPLSEDCLNAMRQFVGNSDNTLTSILSTFNAPLGVFANPLVDAATSRNDFDLRDVRKQRMSIYVVIPPNKLAEASLLVNLFFSLAIDQNTKELPEHNPALKYKCLLLLDEFPALGKVAKYEESIGYIAGYGLRVISIAQSLGQLQKKELYGEEGTRNLVANHLVQIMYAPREQKDAEEYSKILGTFTEKATSRGRSRAAKGGLTNSENESAHKRELMLPQELRQMGYGRIIVMADGCDQPIFGDKIVYYEDPVFKERLLPSMEVAAVDMRAYQESRAQTASGQHDKTELQIVGAKTPPPPVTDTKNPIPQEVTAMADWLFSNVNWVNDNDLPMREIPTTTNVPELEGALA